jgi:hypothetical protein
MDLQKQEDNIYFKWIEPTMIMRKSPDDVTSYILYNRIINFKINNDVFKVVVIEIPDRKSDYTLYIKDFRTKYVKYIETLYPENYNSDVGFNAMIDAIKSLNEDLIIIYKNYAIIGALSYDINDKQKDITIGHIGTIEREKGYGTILMKELFNTAKILEYSVTATSNGFSDDFYHWLGMKRIVDKPLGIYVIKSKYIGDCNYG